MHLTGEEGGIVGFEVKVPSTPEPTKEQIELAKQTGMVIVGMSKQDLYDIFGKELQKAYFREGYDEWITFSNFWTEKEGDVVTFYLEYGKVKGWKEE